MGEDVHQDIRQTDNRKEEIDRQKGQILITTLKVLPTVLCNLPFCHTIKYITQFQRYFPVVISVQLNRCSTFSHYKSSRSLLLQSKRVLKTKSVSAKYLKM